MKDQLEAALAKMSATEIRAKLLTLTKSYAEMAAAFHDASPMAYAFHLFQAGPALKQVSIVVEAA